MKTINPMQLKSIVKKMANEKGISPQLSMQYYVLERFLIRLSQSVYGSRFILKGGLLISTLVGLSARTTMDMDVTVNGLDVSETMVKSVFEDICRMYSEDDFEYRVLRLSQIREGADYPGIRVFLTAIYGKVKTPFSVDVTTGDAITPKEIEYRFPLVFDTGYVNILSYNLETIFAEKLQTILSRGITNTRMRDFYDVYVLNSVYCDEIDYAVLKQAILKTSERRKKNNILLGSDEIMKNICSDNTLRDLWNNYRIEFFYASQIEFDMTCAAVGSLLKKLQQKEF